MWNLIARFLAWRPVAKLLITLAKRTPYFDIHDSDGSLYMGRWWLLQERRWFPWAIRIHHIARADRERDLHDHPYDYRTVILHGGYDELTLDTSTSWHRGDTVARRAQHFHKIETVKPQTWTMFIYRHRWERNNPWGFLTIDDNLGVRKLGWREYIEGKMWRDGERSQ